MTINIPFRLDINKDRDIIELLNRQTNKSAFIRLVLREYNNGVRFVKNTPPPSIDCLDSVLNSIDNL